VIKAEFSTSLLQSSVSHDPLICRFLISSYYYYWCRKHYAFS